MHSIRGETMVLDEGAKFKTEKAAPYSISIQTYLPNVHLSYGQISHVQISLCANIRGLLSDAHFALAQISGHHRHDIGA